MRRASEAGHAGAGVRRNFHHLAGAAPVSFGAGAGAGRCAGVCHSNEFYREEVGMWEEISIQVVRSKENSQVAQVNIAVVVDGKTARRSFEIPASNAGIYVNDHDAMVLNFNIEVEGE